MRGLEAFVGDMIFPVREILVNAYGYKLSRSRFNGEYYDYMKVLISNLEKTSDEIKVEQFEMMRDNLINAYENIPYYTALFNYIDFSPYKMSEISEIEKIPFLDKDKIRQNYDLLISKKMSKQKGVLRYTSGTTGDKLRFVLPFSLAYPKNAAMMYRFYSMAGVHLGDKRVTIGGRRFANKKPYWSYNLFENQMLISAHHLNDKTVHEYIDKINKFNPVFIQGHPNSILFIALAILRKGDRYFDSLRAIFTTGETLLEENRRYIQKAFNVEVLQQYGSGENCFSAQETGDGSGYMLNYEHGYVEMIGDEEYKEVVATSFQNDLMPFVRYKVGDYVKPIRGECLNKRYDYPYLFDQVIGRVDDIVTNVCGGMVFPVTIRNIIKPYLKDFTNYQLCQYAHGQYELKLIDENKEIHLKVLLKSLKGALGSNALIDCVYVDKITSDGGKIRNVVNKNKNVTLFDL